MQKFNQSRFAANRMIYIPIVAVILISTALFLIINSLSSNQASGAVYPDVVFEGEYRIGDGAWKKIDGSHISTTKGTVTLKGNFNIFTPDNEYIGGLSQGTLLAYYCDHISIKFQEQGYKTHVMDTENPVIGKSACGGVWDLYSIKGSSAENIIVTFENHHKFGNDNAVDDFLKTVAIYGGAEFEKSIMREEQILRIVGYIFIISSFILLGVALFSLRAQMKHSMFFGLFSLAAMFAGISYIFSAKSVFYWTGFVIFNTLVSGLSVILYMFFISCLAYEMCRYCKKIALFGLILNLASFVAVLLVSSVTDVLFYDALLIWIAVQLLADVLFISCLLINALHAKTKKRYAYVVMMLPFASNILDVAAIKYNLWDHYLISGIVYTFIFIVAIVLFWMVIPQNAKSAIRADELEIEKSVLDQKLQESRIALMISRIKPHFIYNTLGTIEQLCKTDSSVAAKLVRDFSLYLRGNFDELDRTAPINFLKEMNHVRHYLNIEQVRFPDISIKYELCSNEFMLPALSVQPLVENAIKHGLMGLEKGGTVIIRSYEDDDFYCVSVTDDGIGFDESKLVDGAGHIGLKNIRDRLSAMCNGVLIIKSEIGKGTVALIKIPKEDNDQ